MMRKYNLFSYNWLSVSVVFVQMRIQSGKQYTTCTLHYIVEYIQHSLVYFDHMLDVVGRGYRLAVDFAHALAPLAL